MKDWGDWNVYDWSAALLDYYFAIGEDGDDEPVQLSPWKWCSGRRSA